MAIVNLANYGAVRSHLFVFIPVEFYRTSPTADYTSTYLRFSDKKESYTLNGQTYQGLGKLMDVTGTNSELRNSSQSLTISVSGIPNSAINEIVNSRIKGCRVIVYRQLFDAVSGNVLPSSTGAEGPLVRFRGYITNYSLTEEYDIDTRSSTNTIVFTCASAVDVLNQKVSGRRTNPVTQKKLYPNDLGFDRVPTLKGATFDFGAPQ